ncbi:hypothetical protein PR001_g16839 [Phytophthora rubi]|nr:hypothetical protein PR002_g21483 [Phytophthora rubi]KAE9007951.1 hypothetical protein PR001_g16839 [Phytophthora rubi]
MLVLDAWLFEYLVLVYFSRWRDVRVCSLLFAALLSLVTHVYFHQDLDVMLVLNGVSETSLQLTFLIQISIIGRAVGRKVKVRSIARLTLAAEVLVLLGWLHVLVSILEASGANTHQRLHLIGNVLESVSLIFVVVFRFFYLSLSCGWQRVYSEKKLELALYVAFAVHEVPFFLLDQHTGVKSEFAQGICNRLLIMACILLNIHQKVRPRSRGSLSTKGKRESLVNNNVKGSVASSRDSLVMVPTGRLSVDIPTSLFSSRASIHTTAKRSSNPALPGFPDIAKIAVTTGQQQDVSVEVPAS